MKKYVPFLIFVLFSHFNAWPYSIKQLGIAQGLSNNYVVSITQDKQGFLWFATEEGLNKFDGTRFINYYKYDQCITGNELNRIYADPVDSIIWIATQRNGLNAYHYGRDIFTAYVHDKKDSLSLSTNDITDITSSADGNLWISTYHRGLDYLDKKSGKFQHYNRLTLPDLPSDKIWTVTDGKDGYLYIGHAVQGMSILSLKDKRVKNFRHIPDDLQSLPSNEVKCIYKDSNGNIWVGTNKGLALFNRKTGKFMTFSNRHGEPFVSCIYSINQLDDNKLWIGTELNGVYIMDLKQHIFLSPGQLSLEHITEGGNQHNLSNATARCIFQDSFKNIWIGTYGGGVNFIGNASPLFDRYMYSPQQDDVYSLNNKVVAGICTDRQDRIWIGTDGGGINLFENGERIHVFQKETGDLNHNSVLSAYEDSNNNLWFGTFQAGVHFYDFRKKQFSRVVLDGRADQDIRCFFEDSTHHMWIGTNEGAYVFNLSDKNNRRLFNTGNSLLPENLIRSISQDSNKRMWIGTFGCGLCVFSADMQFIRLFDEYDGFCSNTINHIVTDSKHRIWVATGEGLVCFFPDDLSHYKVYQHKDGLCNTHIRAIIEDGDGNIWFSTNSGISCLRSDSDRIFNYNQYDKSPMGSFMSGSVARDQKGYLYFGSINGLCFFHPRVVLSKRDVPPVIITELKVFGNQSVGEKDKSINLSAGKREKIELGYKENSFNITFNIQDYSLVNQVDYAYNLKGLEDTWYTIAENNVMFRNIPPGHYEFRVKTRIYNQEWGSETCLLSIWIAPPFWMTWWAKLIYFLICAGILYLLLYMYKKRVDMQSFYELEKKNREQEQELNAERLRFYTNITHELRTPLTLILGPLEDIQKDTSLPPKQLQKVLIIHQNATRLLNRINQILEFRKTETQNKKLCVSKDNVAALVQEIGLKYKELNPKTQIGFNVSVENENMQMYFDKEIVTIILDNLLSNAIKYTDKGSIDLSLYTVVKKGVSHTEISVNDTGYGISPEALDKIFDRYYQTKGKHQASGTGIGLALVKNLVALHEGEIKVESILDEGSRFYFTLLTHNIYPHALHIDSDDQNKGIEADMKRINEPDTTTKPILLVVEDNKDIYDYIADSFKDSFEVFWAKNGEEGVHLATSKIPDIIISDIMMPVMNGIVFCRKIKENVQTSHIPVILLTAKDSLQDKEEGYHVGADSYLTKPFSASLLHSRINNLLEARKKLASQIYSNVNISSKSAILNHSLNKLDNEFIQRITTLIEENLTSEKIDITYLSDKMCMSSSTLYRKVKALTGISTNEFVKKVKMKNAEQLLLEGKYNVSEIAFKVGINSPVYFRQCFKDEFGMSPTDYLKQLRDKL